MIDYEFKPAEFWWGLLYAALAYLGTLLLTDFAAVTDWRAYAISAAIGLARVLVAYVLTHGPHRPRGPA